MFQLHEYGAVATVQMVTQYPPDGRYWTTTFLIPDSASVAVAVRVTVSFTGDPGFCKETDGGVQSLAAETVDALLVWEVNVAEEEPGMVKPTPPTSSRARRAAVRRKLT